MSVAASPSLLRSRSLADVPSTLSLTTSHTANTLQCILKTSRPIFLSHNNSKKLPSILFKCYPASPLCFCSLCNLLLPFSSSNFHYPLWTLTHSFVFYQAPVASACACSLLFLLLSCVVSIPLIPIGFSLIFSSQSATWGCCSLYLMMIWHQQWCVWAVALAWSAPDPWGSKTVLCTRLAPEGPSSSQLLSVDFFCRFKYLYRLTYLS